MNKKEIIQIILYFDSCFSKIHCLWAPLSVNEDVGTTFSSITLGGTLMPTALKQCLLLLGLGQPFYPLR